MKCLSLIQPWATLIAIEAKKIETRSWKTNYRGIIYIHASKRTDKKVLNKDVFSLTLGDTPLPNGEIIASCKLVDCIKMDENFINKVKQMGYEYEFGEYTIGRYGWILEDVELLDTPIKTNGHLGIWNYEEEN